MNPGRPNRMELHDTPQLPRPISHIYFRCSKESRTELLARMQISEGTVLSDELLQSTRDVVKAFDARLEILVQWVLPREAFHRLPPEVRNRLTPSAIDEGVKVTIHDPATVPQRIRVEGSAQELMSIAKVMPAYPGMTREGTHQATIVQLTVVVGKDGAVLEAKPLAGPDSLMDCAIDAVRQWKYRPTLLNGLPVEIQTTVEVRFEPNG